MAMGIKTRSALALACGALALSACGQSDSGPKTMEQAQQEAAKLDRPAPGQYAQTMTISRFELPDAPPEMAQQMKAMLGQDQKTEFCLTAEEAEKGFQDMFQEVGKDGECKYERFDVSGGRLDAVLQCQSEAEGKGTIKLTGNVTSQGSQVEVEMDMTSPASPMGRTLIGMKMETRRIGDCPAAG